MNPFDLFLKVIEQFPQIANNPSHSEAIKALKNRDATRGEELARNYCNTFGVSPEDGEKQAKSFFENFPFGGN